MGHGSVSNEIKGKRDAATMGWNQSLINIDENGASFRSYIDGLTYDLTPEKSIDIQRKVNNWMCKPYPFITASILCEISWERT